MYLMITFKNEGIRMALFCLVLPYCFAVVSRDCVQS